MTAYEIGCMVLEFLPDTVGMTDAEIEARLGFELPKETLEPLWDENLAEQYFVKEGGPRHWRWRMGMKHKHNVLTAEVLWDVTQDEDYWTEEELAKRNGAFVLHVRRAMERTRARGWTREERTERGERRYRPTPFGREVVRVGQVLSDALPFRESGRSMSLGEIIEKAGCDERAARAALEGLALHGLLGEVEPEAGGERRWWGDWDPPDTVYEKVETWQQKRAKETN